MTDGTDRRRDHALRQRIDVLQAEANARADYALAAIRRLLVGVVVILLTLLGGDFASDFYDDRERARVSREACAAGKRERSELVKFAETARDARRMTASNPEAPAGERIQARKAADKYGEVADELRKRTGPRWDCDERYPDPSIMPWRR